MSLGREGICVVSCCILGTLRIRLSDRGLQGKALQDWHPQGMKKAGLGTEVEGMMKAVLELSWLCRVVPPGK